MYPKMSQIMVFLGDSSAQIKAIKSSPKQVLIWSGWPKLNFRVLILIARKYCEIKMITYVLWK